MDYNDQQVHYDYENIECENYNKTITNITNALYNQDSVLETINQCSNCKKTFNALSIGTEQTYLYPISVNDANCSSWINLSCSRCSNEFIALVYVTFNDTNNTYTNLTKYDNSWFYMHATKYGACSIPDNNLIYNKDYVLEQLNKGYEKELLEVE